MYSYVNFRLNGQFIRKKGRKTSALVVVYTSFEILNGNLLNFRPIKQALSIRIHTCFCNAIYFLWHHVQSVRTFHLPLRITLSIHLFNSDNHLVLFSLWSLALFYIASDKIVKILNVANFEMFNHPNKLENLN